ncbi:MAG: hypothetical protein ACR2K3_08260 [Nocardioides sp.]
MLNEPDAVSRQYATEGNLETRRSVWQPGAGGGPVLISTSRGPA